jgi:hypothetical protein
MLMFLNYLTFKNNSMTLLKYFSNSTYGISYDFSFKGEEFYSVSSHWKLGSRPILKIRVANWTPKTSRNKQAILYYDVKTKQEALNIIESYRSFDFKAIEDEFEKMWNKDNFEDKGYFNTGQTNDWWNNKFYPYIRNFIILKTIL